ncbi:MAG: Hpt domain-containing protein, partial [Candidatus Angelobacter sp.]
MNFFSDERAAEMRELFFESAAELLQTLNEQGLKLEKHPLDKEVLREVRRTVHTLKGDSAACGYEQLSDLAHLLEDALTPEVAAITAESLAEVVLIAADTFGSMLSAYRGELQPPDGEELKEQIISLTRRHAKKQPCKLQARFVWSEYEQMEIAEALQQRENVYYIALSIDPQCPMRSAALQLVHNVIQECGRVLAIVPGQSAGAQDVDVVEAAIASEYQQSAIEAKCRIPSVVLELLLRKADSDAPATALQTRLPAENETRARAEDLVRPVDANEALEEAAPTNPASFSHLETLLRVDAERIDAVLDLVGELIIAKSMLHQTISEFDRRFPRDPLKTRFADALAFQARIMNDLQKSVMKIRMVPVEHLF